MISSEESGARRNISQHKKAVYDKPTFTKLKVFPLKSVETQYF